MEMSSDVRLARKYKQSAVSSPVWSYTLFRQEIPRCLSNRINWNLLSLQKFRIRNINYLVEFHQEITRLVKRAQKSLNIIRNKNKILFGPPRSEVIRLTNIRNLLPRQAVKKPAMLRESRMHGNPNSDLYDPL